MKVVISFAIAYLLGAINFSIVVSRLFRQEDIREKGSGNAGFTNILRTYGKGLAALVLVFDVLKALLAAWISLRIAPSQPLAFYAAGLGVILGHNFPVYYHFKGGKGVLTSISIMVVADPVSAFICIPIAVGIMFLTGYVSIGSLFIFLYFPVSMMLLHAGNVPLILFAWLVCCLGFWMHRGNIKNLLNGTERRFGKRGKEKDNG